MKDAIVIFGIIATVAAINFLLGYQMAERRYQQQAVARHVAEYYSDEQGAVQWRWKDCEQSENIINSKTVLKPSRTIIFPDFQRLICEADCK